MIPNKRKMLEEYAIKRIAKENNISKDEARNIYNSLSQKKKRKLITTIQEEKT